MTHDVFISYSSENQDIADVILNALETQGISCWISTRDIPSGKRFGSSLVEAIANSRVMVVVFSAHADISEWVMREVERAIHYKLTIVPFRIENTPPTKSMEFFLSSVEWLDAWQPPVHDHLKTLYDRVRHIIADTKNRGQATNGKTITSKQRKAYDLAYDAEKRNSPNPSHAALWLGSRYLPAFDLFEMTRKLTLQELQMVDKSLFCKFEEYEKQIGFNIGFERFFDVIIKEPDFNKEVSLRAGFLDKTMALIADRHGEKMIGWWALGISLSTLWYWTKQGGGRNVNADQMTQIKNTMNSINTILGLVSLPKTLKDDFNTTLRDTSISINPESLNKWVLVWTALIEMYLLVEEYEISLENAEILLEINPELATFVLQQYLKKSPDDAQAVIMIGKASLKTFSDELSLEPLFRTDPVKILTWSMKRSIQLNPDSEWSNRARIILKKINN